MRRTQPTHGQAIAVRAGSDRATMQRLPGQRHTLPRRFAICQTPPDRCLHRVVQQLMRRGSCSIVKQLDEDSIHLAVGPKLAEPIARHRRTALETKPG
jgi:hypothetical protein